MSLEDPLEEYRVGEAEALDEVEAHVAGEGRLTLRAWGKGGPPVALTADALYFVADQTTLYKVRKAQVRAFGLTRASNLRMMRWGLLSYFVSLPLFFLSPLITILLAVVGGVLTVQGFLNKAILLQVRDERVPPFIIRHGKWRNIQAELLRWHKRAANG